MAREKAKRHGKRKFRKSKWKAANSDLLQRFKRIYTSTAGVGVRRIVSGRVTTLRRFLNKMEIVVRASAVTATAAQGVRT